MVDAFDPWRETPLPDCILERFAPWSGVTCWVICNEKKQPCEIRTGKLAKWRSDPQDNIIKLSELNELATCGVVDHWGGFGVILGQDNLLCCIDFDHALDDNGEVINPEVDVFLEELQTFVEVSSSGHGLHAFIDLDIPHEEYGMRSTFCDGKCYVDRFIKMTGRVYKKYNLPVRLLYENDYDKIKERIGEPYVEIKKPEPNIQMKGNPYRKYSGSGSKDSWEHILSTAYIPVIQSNYSGKIRHGKRVIESWRIECPNRKAHLTDRPGDPSAHLAVLNKYDDGTTSVSCSHNSCSPQRKPNLLQKLWDKIKSNKEKIGKSFLDSMRVE